MEHTKRSSMKFLLLVMICGIIEGQVSLCNAQNSSHIQTRQGWDELFPIHGDVVSVIRKEYTLNDVFGQHVKDDKPSNTEVYKFNTLGDVVECTKYKSNDVLESKTLYKYSPDNLLVDKSLYGEDGFLSIKTLYTYDENGLLTETKEYSGSAKIIVKENYTYHTDSMQVKYTWFRKNGDISFVTKETLDNSGNTLSSELDSNGDGTFYRNRWNSYQYGEDGTISEIVSYNENNIAVSRELREYNSDKCVIALFVYDYENKLSDKYEYQYDEFNNVIEIRQYWSELLLPQNIVEYYYDYRDDVEIDLQIPDSYEEPAFIKVDVMPKFMGGDLNTFRMWFAQEFKIPEKAVQKKIQGKVVVQFVVERDGSISNIEFLQSPDPVYNEEIIRILNKSPKWTPGYQRGVPVRVRYILPIDCRF